MERSDITAALRTVTDPDLGGNVVDAGLVTDVTVEDGTVTLDVELAGLAPETAEDVVEEMRREVLSLPGVETARVDGETPAAQSDDLALPADRVIAVASAKGGVGKTTVAASLARGLAERGESVGLFDADLHGPNVPRVVGAEGPVTANDAGRAEPIDADGLDVMSLGLLENDEPIAWRGAMAHEALLDLLTDTAWGDLDTLVIDLPPGTGDIVLTTLQEIPVDGVVLVTTPYPTAIGDTGRSVELFRENGIPVLGAAVNMAGFTCPTCGDEHDVFGTDAVDDLDVPVLAEVPIDDDVQTPEPPLADPVRALVESVRDRIEAAGVAVPDDALDVGGLPAGIRIELVTEEFDALDPGQELWVVTDREPDSLLAAVGASDGADGEEAVADCEVHRTGSEEWAFRVERGNGAPDRAVSAVE